MLAISTSEYSQTQLSTKPILKGACTVAVILACISPNCASATPIQNIGTENATFFSTDIANNVDYYNGNISLYWDGVSVMSADRSDSLLRILEIEKLENNWNGNDATSFSKNILDAARTIVMQLSIQPAIFPTARDSIQFEYENSVGDYLEFELFDNGRVKMFSYTHSGVATTTDITAKEINKVVNRFYGQDI